MGQSLSLSGAAAHLTPEQLIVKGIIYEKGTYGDGFITIYDVNQARHTAYNVSHCATCLKTLSTVTTWSDYGRLITGGSSKNRCQC